MALSNAERQRKYRERQKEKYKEKYLEKEAKRKRNAYIPSSQLSQEALNNRREELRQKSKRFYWRHKQTKNRQSDDEAEEQSTSQLKVKLPILKKDRFRKTYRRSLRKAYRRNEELKEKNEKLTEKCDDLRKKNKTLHKRIERINKTQKKKLMKKYR